MKLYHTPISPNSRRVWIALLEKNLDFELVEIHLDGDNLQPEFGALPSALPAPSCPCYLGVVCP
jgi:glutathione S-transferase